VHDYLDLWSYDGTLDRIHHALYAACREQSDCHHSASMPRNNWRDKRISIPPA
jgi:hypothetical protein